MDRTIAVGGDPSTGERTINLTSSLRPSKVENKRHKRHTRLKPLCHKAFRVWRFGRANATNATQTPPNATQTPPAPMGGTTAIALHRLEEDGIPVAIHRHDCPSSVLPTAGQLPTGWIPPLANTSGDRDIGASPEDAGQRPAGVGMESLSPATPRPAGSCLQLITAPSSAPPTTRRPPLRAWWIPPLIWGRMGRRSGSLLIGSVRCYPLQTSSQWFPQWWGRGSLPNYTPSS